MKKVNIVGRSKGFLIMFMIWQVLKLGLILGAVIASFFVLGGAALLLGLFFYLLAPRPKRERVYW